MQPTAREEYQLTQVMTATPQKLQLTVIEIALRSSMQAKSLSEARQDGPALTALLHAQKAVTSILAGLKYDDKTPLVSQVASLYLFIYKSMVQSHLERNLNKLADAIRLLEIERETWRQVCEVLDGSSTHEPISSVPSPMFERTHAPLAMPALETDSYGSGSLSFEA